MNFINDISINSLIAKYTLENLKDVYVEGTSDVNVLKKVVKCFEKVKVYSINSVKIETEDHEINSCNKNKVIFLIDKLKELKNCPKGFVDRDFDDWVECTFDIPKNVYYTDKANMEMYYVNNESVKNISESFNVKIDLDSFFDILSCLFFKRFATYLYDKRMSIFSVDRYFSVDKNGVVSFDDSKHSMTTVMNGSIKGVKYDDYVKFLQKMKKIKKDVIDSGYIHSHDTFDLLRFIVNSKHQGVIKDESVMRSILLLSVENYFDTGAENFRKVFMEK